MQLNHRKELKRAQPHGPRPPLWDGVAPATVCHNSGRSLINADAVRKARPRRIIWSPFQFQISALIQLVSFGDTLIIGSRRVDGIINNSRIHGAKGTLSGFISSVGGDPEKELACACQERCHGINGKFEHLTWKHSCQNINP